MASYLYTSRFVIVIFVFGSFALSLRLWVTSSCCFISFWFYWWGVQQEDTTKGFKQLATFLHTVHSQTLSKAVLSSARSRPPRRMLTSWARASAKPPAKQRRKAQHRRVLLGVSAVPDRMFFCRCKKKRCLKQWTSLWNLEKWTVTITWFVHLLRLCFINIHKHSININEHECTSSSRNIL